MLQTGWIEGPFEPQSAERFLAELVGARWVVARTEAGDVPALAFVAWTKGPRYAGILDDEKIATYIAHACGHTGPGAEYLRETAAKCAELGIEDEHLFRIETLVARHLSDAAR